MRSRGTARELELRRSIGGGLLLEGKRPAEVARTVGVSWTTANRWKQVIEEEGLGALAAKAHPGRTARLTQNQRQRLIEILLNGPLEAGFPTETWTSRRVAEVIEREFGVSYHVGHVWKILRRIGWTSQRPQHQSRKRDAAEIQRWREQEWSRIKKRLKKGQ